MLRSLAPKRREGCFAFRGADEARELGIDRDDALAVFFEDEGLSLIVPVEPTVPDAMVCVTLHVYSDLNAVGLTAAVAQALGEVGIPCNMVAALHHDHIFVPVAQAGAAMSVLDALSAEARDAGSGRPGGT